ncbi:PAS domain S-box protein [Mucilaginibacter calamicampi]|uniref:histidine kinase n=1 Tax=Mucilaginibacter calamicampi TaxID=1302352 RepID=A0ABW2Z0L5_9SPHI
MNSTSVNAQESSENQLQRFKKIIDGAGMGTWEHNLQTHELIYNEHWANMIGYRIADLQPITVETWRTLIHPEDLPRARQKMYEHLEGKARFYEIEVRFKHRDGRWVWVLDKGSVATFTADGKPEWIMGSIQDITERKNNELLLTHYRDLLQSTKKVAQIGSWEMDLVEKKLDWSSVTKSIYGVTRDYEPAYEDIINFHPDGENRQKIEEKIASLVKNAAPFDEELQITTPGNELKWVRVVATPVITKDKCIRIYGLLQDINGKNTALKKLALQEEQFRLTFEFAPNGMALVSPQGKWLKINKNLCRLLGYTEQELFASDFQQLTHPDDLEADLILMHEVLAGVRDGYTMGKRYLHKNGSMVHALLSVSLVKNEQGEPQYFISQINDITQLKSLEFALKESLDKMKSIQDASTRVGIIETDRDGLIRVFNVGAENLLGYKATELLNTATPLLFYNKTEIADRATYLARLYGQPITGFNTLTVNLQTNTFETLEWTLSRKNGSEFIVQATVTPVKNIAGAVSGYLFIFFDITLLKDAEREITSLLDVTREQNNRLLNFAHIVSHNLRSHSGNISMVLELMKEETPASTQNEFYPLLQKASGNLTDTIAHLNEIVLMNTGINKNMVPLNLFDYVEKAELAIQAILSENQATIQNEVAKDLFVQAIPAYLESIILNLLTNALKYKSPFRKPVINIGAQADGNYVSITVSDNGSGIDLKLHGNKLFGMYKTFHGNRDARGIGLFITKNQVEAMGGTIQAESEINVGTVFTVHLQKQIFTGN